MLNALNYEKIDDTSIRLVFIQVPSQADVGSDGLISCRLTTFPISTCPWYTCLSYAWDEPLATRDGLDSTIEVNGSEISVQPNLYQTLRQWIAAVHRGDLVDHKPTWFWLDAICIDQSNVRERTLQVSIMHRICRDAKWGTVVWLGPDPDAEVYTVRESFRALVQQYYDPEIPMKYPTDFLLHEKVFPGHLPPCDAEIWKVTMRFWDRAWFGRSIAFNLLELAQTSSFYIRSGVGWTLIPFRHGHLWPDKSYEGRAVGAHGSRDNANRVLLLEAPRSDEIVVDQGPVADRLTGFAKIAS